MKAIIREYGHPENAELRELRRLCGLPGGNDLVVRIEKVINANDTFITLGERLIVSDETYELIQTNLGAV